MALETDMAAERTNESIGKGRFLRYVLLTFLGVNLVNVVILVVALSLFEYASPYVGGPFGPLAVGPVVANSTIAAIGAAIVYGLLTRYSNSPNRTFTVVAVAVLVLSFAMFLAPDMSGAPSNVFLTLGVMHLAAAVVIVGVLTRIPKQAVAVRTGG